MSGEAGAVLESELYSLYLGSGRMMNVAIPPGGDNSYIGKYFDTASERFRGWLERAKPQLDALFAQLIVEGMPIVPRALEWVEEGEAAASPKVPILLRLSGSERMPNHQSLQLSFMVTRRVDKADAAKIVERVAKILRTTMEKLEELPAPRPPSLWARLFRRSR